MNFQLLKRVFTRPVRLAPTPMLYPRDGGPPVPFDEPWLVRVCDGPPRSAQFECLSYGYVISLQADSMHDYRTTGHVMLKVQLVIHRNGITLRPLPDPRELAARRRLRSQRWSLLPSGADWPK